MLPFQQEKILAHSFVLGAELGTRYTYTYVKDSEHHRLRILIHLSRPFLRNFS